MKKYYPGIDILKGILILLVITGHILQGTLNENPVRYIIYSFHMPLFLAVSGFLIKKNYIYNVKLLELLKHYYHRLIIPWFFATLIYLLINKFHEFIGLEVSLKNIVTSFVFPEYHFWYVPALILMIIFLRFIISLDLKKWMIFFLLFSLSAFITIFWDKIGNIHIIVSCIIDTYKPHFFIYLLYGFIIRDTLETKGELICFKNLYLLFLPLIFIRLLNFEKGEFLTLDFIPLNILIINIIISHSFNMKTSNRLLEWIGRNSLPLYLWHVIIIRLMKYLLLDKFGEFIFYEVTIVSIAIILFPSIYLMSKVDFIDKYLLGNIKSY